MEANMKKVYYAVYDRKAEMYMPPFLEVKDGTAIRALQDAIASKDHPFAKHPEDFSLFQLGVFDDETGMITANEKPVKLQEIEKLIVE